MHYVIIGNSAAAIGCVEGIRSVDTCGPITLIASEPHHTYSRPLISYLACGKTDEQRMQYRPADFYVKNGCTPLLGQTVERIDAARKSVYLPDGTAIAYDRLLVATGSRPFVPPMQGLDTVEKKHTFMTLDDEKALMADLTPQSRVLILGAGLIGLKCAEGIHAHVGSITVVDMANRILPSILDETGSALVQRHIEAKGVQFQLSDSVARFVGSRAILQSGRTIDFDVLVIAVGVRPNTELLKQAGADVAKGVLVDVHCRTSLTDIYAAGDCTESLDITTGQRRILALLPNAYMQGECAGICMAGGECRYEQAMPMNAIGFFGLHLITAGSYDGTEHIVEQPNGYKKLVTKDNVLKGYILIGSIERAGIYTAMIREQTPLDTLDFAMIEQKPQLMAFSKRQRQQTLGGVV